MQWSWSDCRLFTRAKQLGYGGLYRRGGLYVLGGRSRVECASLDGVADTLDLEEEIGRKPAVQETFDSPQEAHASPVEIQEPERDLSDEEIAAKQFKIAIEDIIESADDAVQFIKRMKPSKQSAPSLVAAIDLVIARWTAVKREIEQDDTIIKEA